MRKEVLKKFEGQDNKLGGDGQCDSPGINAKNYATTWLLQGNN